MSLNPYQLARRAEELQKDEALQSVLDSIDRQAFELFKMANSTDEQRLYAYHLAQSVDIVRAALQTLIDNDEIDTTH